VGLKEAAMRFLGACSVAAALAGPMPLAWAQPISGLYVSGSFGAAFPRGRVEAPAATGEAPAPVPSGSAVSGNRGVGQGSIGYGFGNGLRVEMEGTGSAGQLRLPHWP
jgi:OOP family OmpA-OmpF porin